MANINIFQKLKFKKKNKAVEHIDVAESVGRVVAQDVFCEEGLPRFARSTRDGIGFNCQVVRKCLEEREEQKVRVFVYGESRPGEEFVGNEVEFNGNDVCGIYITTGGVLEGGVDCVVEIEFFEQESKSEIYIDRKTLESKLIEYKNIRKVGSDIPSGTKLLTSHDLITPSKMTNLLMCGIFQILVLEKLTIAILSTGSELSDIQTPLKHAQIFDINRYMLKSLIHQFRYTLTLQDFGILTDEKLTSKLTQISSDSSIDIIITTGSLSKGDKDMILDFIHSLNGQLVFSRLPLKPGKPMTLAVVNDTVLCALPGNPSSAFVGFHLLVRSVVKYMYSRREHMVLGDDLQKLKCKAGKDIFLDASRTEFCRCKVDKIEESNMMSVSPSGNQASSSLLSANNADVLFLLPSQKEHKSMYMKTGEIGIGFCLNPVFGNIVESGETKSEYNALVIMFGSVDSDVFHSVEQHFTHVSVQSISLRGGLEALFRKSGYEEDVMILSVRDWKEFAVFSKYAKNLTGKHVDGFTTLLNAHCQASESRLYRLPSNKILLVISMHKLDPALKFIAPHIKFLTK